MNELRLSVFGTVHLYAKQPNIGPGDGQAGDVAYLLKGPQSLLIAFDGLLSLRHPPMQVVQPYLNQSEVGGVTNVFEGPQSLLIILDGPIPLTPVGVDVTQSHMRRRRAVSICHTRPKFSRACS